MDAVSNPLAAELPPNHRTPPGARLLGRLQLTALAVLAAQARRWRKGWLSLPPLPVVPVVYKLTAALKAGRPEGRRQRAARPAWGDLPAGSARWPEMARARARLAGEVAVAVLRARQARNCVPKPFHYFELVLLTPLRQPKLGPLRLSPVARVEHEETVRILRRPSSCASASSEAQGDRDLAADAGPRGPSALRPPGVENSNSNSKLLLPSTIYLVLDLIAHPASCARGKAPRSGLRAATPVRASTGEGAGEGEGGVRGW